MNVELKTLFFLALFATRHQSFPGMLILAINGRTCALDFTLGAACSKSSWRPVNACGPRK